MAKSIRLLLIIILQFAAASYLGVLRKALPSQLLRTEQPTISTLWAWERQPEKVAILYELDDDDDDDDEGSSLGSVLLKVQIKDDARQPPSIMMETCPPSAPIASASFPFYRRVRAKVQLYINANCQGSSRETREKTPSGFSSPTASRRPLPPQPHPQPPRPQRLLHRLPHPQPRAHYCRAHNAFSNDCRAHHGRTQHQARLQLKT